jgi:hypothetical protein
MTLSHFGITHLSSIPNMKMLLLKAAFKRSSFDPRTCSDIPLLNNTLYFDEVELDEHKYRLYHHVVTSIFRKHTLMLLVFAGFSISLIWIDTR